MICHFSCGATSAVATLITILEGNCDGIVYADPGAEHPSNMAFLKEFEELTQIKIDVVRSEKYKTPEEVCVDKRYLSGVSGAPCTSELKKIPIRNFLGDRLYKTEQVFGYTKDESKRIDRFIGNNPELSIDTPLVRLYISKNDCKHILEHLGIKLPYMYELGYKNANCIGCVKASSQSYWAAIREDFPDVFKRYAILERELGAIGDDGRPKGAAINKVYKKGIRHRLFLDEFGDDIKPKRNLSFSCGYTCGGENMDFDFIEDNTALLSKNGSVLLDKIKLMVG